MEDQPIPTQPLNGHTPVNHLGDRYCVLKVRDVSHALTSNEKYALLTLIQKCNAYRKASRNAPPLDGLIVEIDWPEYGPTRDALLKRINETAEAQADIPNH